MASSSNRARPEARPEKVGKVRRYRPGVVPDWLKEDEEDDEEGLVRSRERGVQPQQQQQQQQQQSPPSPQGKQRRRKHLAEAQVIHAVVKAPVTSTVEVAAGFSSSSDSEEEDEETQRRARLRAKQEKEKEKQRKEEEEESSIVQQRKSRKAPADPISDSSSCSSDSDSDSSSSSSSSEDEMEHRVLYKPTFVRKSQRVTIQERDAAVLAELEKEEEQKERLEQRKLESERLVVEKLKAEEAAKATNAVENGDEALIDDRDDEDDEAEREAWKLRELRRLQRDYEEEKERLHMEAERARRATLTDAQLMEEDAQTKPIRQKGQVKFGTQYFHKGAFYHADDARDERTRELLTRDMSGPTQSEAGVDRETLPAVMRHRKFGQKGISRYTNLRDQDTTHAGNTRRNRK